MQIGERRTRATADSEVGDDVDGDEQPVVAPQHRRGRQRASRRARRETPASNRSTPNALGVRAQSAPGRTVAPATARIAVGERARASRSSTSSAGRRRARPSRSAPPRPSAIDRPAAGHALRPARCRSPLRRAARAPCARRYASRSAVVVDAPRNSTVGPASARSRASIGAGADDLQRHAEPGGGVDRDVDALVRHQGGHHQEMRLRRRRRRA